MAYSRGKTSPAPAICASDLFKSHFAVFLAANNRGKTSPAPAICASDLFKSHFAVFLAAENLPLR